MIDMNPDMVIVIHEEDYDILVPYERFDSITRIGMVYYHVFSGLLVIDVYTENYPRHRVNLFTGEV